MTESPAPAALRRPASIKKCDVTEREKPHGSRTRKTYPLQSGSVQARRTEMMKTTRARYMLEFKQ